MSWFDTTGFVNVAKSALKEAQKTIDKALDITEEEAAATQLSAASSSSTKDESDSFFSAWGIKGDSPSLSNIKPSSSQDSVASSLWGSFTGSFFENKPSPSGESTSDIISNRDQESANQSSSSSPLKEEVFASEQCPANQDKVEASATEEVKRRRRDPVVAERLSNRHSYPGNRLSVISSESDRPSSDSIEVLGSTSCTTTPDSELPSSVSASSFGSGRRPISASSPDSVEVLQDSESLEILGSRSSSASLSSPQDPPSCVAEKFQTEATSPSDVEVIAEEEEDASIADDSYASASASESTMTQATVLDHTPVIAMDSSIDSCGAVELASQRTDNSLSSLLLDSSTDTLHSDSSRAGLQLPLTVKTNKLKPLNSVLKKSVPTGTRSDKDCAPKLVQKSTLPSDSSVVLIAPLDSSGDGTLVESGSDDALRLSDSDGRSSRSGSGYVRSLLADAMGEETASPAPASHHHHHGDGARLGSEQTSGHTSGDEQETTTSSDIEIISSPNGDGSSTTSRTSPIKLPHRVTTGSSDLLKFPGKVKASAVLTWLLVILAAVGGGAGCSIRSTAVRGRFMATTSPRPNVTFPTYNCPPHLLENFCLNGGTCFAVKTHLNSEYYCECPDGFWGNRCDFKYILETAGITGGATIAVLVMFLVCVTILLYRRSRKERAAGPRGSFDSSSPVVQGDPVSCPLPSETSSAAAWLSDVP